MESNQKWLLAAGLFVGGGLALAHLSNRNDLSVNCRKRQATTVPDIGDVYFEDLLLGVAIGNTNVHSTLTSQVMPLVLVWSFSPGIGYWRTLTSLVTSTDEAANPGTGQ